MVHISKENIQRWIDGWKREDQALLEIKRHELRAFDFEKNREWIDEMLQWAFEHRTIRTTSGLVEQQRLFMKMRDKL